MLREVFISGELREMAGKGNFTFYFRSFLNDGILGYIYLVIFRIFNLKVLKGKKVLHKCSSNALQRQHCAR